MYYLKSPNKPNQSILLTMYPSTNIHSRYTSSKETLAIVPTTSPTTPCISKSDLNNIHNYIKTMTDKHKSDMKALNNRIYDMLAKLTDTSFNTYKQEEQLTDISSKLSTYEDRLEKLSTTKTNIQPLSLQITQISSKLSAYENRLDKMSIANTTKFETEMK